MARRDPVGIRLITRRGNDWTIRFPLVVEAVNHLTGALLPDRRRGGVLRRAGRVGLPRAPPPRGTRRWHSSSPSIWMALLMLLAARWADDKTNAVKKTAACCLSRNKRGHVSRFARGSSSLLSRACEGEASARAAPDRIWREYNRAPLSDGGCREPPQK